MKALLDALFLTLFRKQLIHQALPCVRCSNLVFSLVPRSSLVSYCFEFYSLSLSLSLSLLLLS